MINVWRYGVAGVVIFITVMLTGIALVDIFFAAARWRPVGARLQDWAGRYPRYALGLVLLMGALLGHFFLNH